MCQAVPKLIIQFFILCRGEFPKQGLGPGERKTEVPRHIDLAAQVQSLYPESFDVTYNLFLGNFSEVFYGCFEVIDSDGNNLH